MKSLLLITVLAFAPACISATHSPYDEVADYVGVPRDILYAMALAESGRVRDGDFRPWPWTLNIAGQARFYADREAMFAALMTALQNHQLRVDVGPLQLNWYWQYPRIASPWRLTDPLVNAKIAASLLRKHYETSNDWWLAVGHYHRPRETTAADRRRAAAYRQRVRELRDRYVNTPANAEETKVQVAADG